MVTNPVAIQTSYHGYRFRSRLEARWAVVFESLGVEWQYEPEGYRLYHGFYLPDFFLPDIGHIEIKRETPTRNEVDLAVDLSLATGPVYIFFGPIPRVRDCNILPEVEQQFEDSAYFINATSPDMGYRWCECPECGKLGIQWNGYANRNCKCFNHRVQGDDSERIMRAYNAARSARFEHGESPE